jgi:arsenate reductase
MKIYHNPRCTKSRQTLQLIESAGKEVEIVEYLTDTPSRSELKKIIALLGITPEQLLRKNEDVYKEKFKGKTFTDDEWIQIMIENPKLIERPIVIQGDKSVLCRLPEKVKMLL